jgi:hypothetical protein
MKVTVVLVLVLDRLWASTNSQQDHHKAKCAGAGHPTPNLFQLRIPNCLLMLITQDIQTSLLLLYKQISLATVLIHHFEREALIPLRTSSTTKCRLGNRLESDSKVHTVQEQPTTLQCLALAFSTLMGECHQPHL